jgi:VWFA-related protein
MATRLPARGIWSLLSLPLFCAGISAAVAGDPIDYTYRTSSNEVRLSFSAADQNDHGVATLQPGDFAVVDKDVIVRNFQSFTRSHWTKLGIAVVIDTSGSVAPHFRQEIGDVLDLLSQTTGIPDENLAIFSFRDARPVMLCAGDCRAFHAIEPVPARSANDLTPLFDTIVFASDFLSQRGDVHTQRLLIVFSDGADTASGRSLRDAIDASLRHDVQIECIDLSAHSSSDSAVLQSLANSTGGHYFPAPDGASHALRVILESLQANYTVSYRLPARVPGFHSIRILPTHNLNLQFRSRSGYYYPEQTR